MKSKQEVFKKFKLLPVLTFNAFKSFLQSEHIINDQKTASPK